MTCKRSQRFYVCVYLQLIRAWFPLLQLTQQACTHYLTLILSLVRLVQAATQAQYYKYDELDQDFPDDESVGAATVKSMPVVASTAGMLLCVCIYVWVCA